jgi:hypothetical protein
MTTSSLFERLGPQTVRQLDGLHKKKKIVALNHQGDGPCLILLDGSKLLLSGTSEEDSRRLVGYLGLYGGGEHGLEPPAFVVPPQKS